MSVDINFRFVFSLPNFAECIDLVQHLYINKPLLWQGKAIRSVYKWTFYACYPKLARHALCSRRTFYPYLSGIGQTRPPYSNMWNLGGSCGWGNQHELMHCSYTLVLYVNIYLRNWWASLTGKVLNFVIKKHLSRKLTFFFLLPTIDNCPGSYCMYFSHIFILSV